MRARRLLGALVAAGALIAGGLVATPATAATGDLGFKDQSYLGATYPATSDKPQSKLWFTGGYWFADMFDTVSKTWHIFRLDRPTEKWIDTGTKIDSRVNTLGDALWDGTHLYIASHVVAYSTDTAPKPSVSGAPAYLTRYTFNAATSSFTPDTGFPKTITTQSSESMTIDEDSTGTIWATWTQVSGNATSGYTNAVYLNNGTSGGTTWGTPFVVPVTGSNPSPDDISSVVKYGGNKIGLMWSNELTQSVYFASHTDGATRTTWTGGPIPGLTGSHSADDHLNLKSIVGDSAGRIFAAVKTSADASSTRKPTDPLLVLVEYTPASGWIKSTIATLADCNTRPQVMLDTQHSIIHVLSSAPTGTSCASTNAQTIYDKTASFTNPVFATGHGTPIIRSAAETSTTTEYMNNATTTKQSVNGNTGLIVLAGDTSTKTYWHADINLGGGTGDTTPPSTPGSFKATVASNTQVNLSWTASTDNVGVTGYRVYRGGTLLTTTSGTTLGYNDTTAAAGTTYTYQVSAIDAAGNESVKASATVTTTGGTTGTTISVTPTADATVQSANPSTNYGAATRLTADGSPLTAAFLKFTVSGSSACTVTKAVLNLTVGPDTGNDSVYGGDFYAVADTTWTETGITWSTKPAAGAKIGSIPGAVALNSAQSVDVTPYITGYGTYSIELATTNADAVAYKSKESATAAQWPHLVVTCG
ncbi:DNRLRE domain-containing protein [Amnibacterium sp. CER49]|uniref:CBM96 family carbohydrate-binding protein n=1 Tax=Amnibacterium sp. CER49 TaxID=3039161 RepID=UPI00244C5937|nr:DNRLRE domain-containing protein [Amnibacterium sp. CER49]MDH2443028.1 DNRLRE domain-containing protein [Amnibacterium sp. CER49]